MAEVKNSFLLSKMNKDLDNRLIPNGEYRNALNISIGKSESDDVGAVQNILGNSLFGDILLPGGTKCIGYFMDNPNNRIYQFITNNYSSFVGPIYNAIYVADLNIGPNPIVLVSGDFLNFSQDNIITGINLVENLLFWTDNRNQPRKINVQSAILSPATSLTPYYTQEHQISVAKYAPVEAISLVKKVETTTTEPSAASTTITVASTTGIIPGMTVIGGGLVDSSFVLVESVNVGLLTVTVSIPVTLADNAELLFLISTMSDDSEKPLWPGDPAYLTGRYVRFSHRFRFDDGEYSITAPFTQIVFIPNQKGYFINGDETNAYTSTVLNWMENNINNIQLLIPFPDICSNSINSYKIQALDILYKESDATAVSVVETIPAAEFQAVTDSNIYMYEYQSTKPYKVLPSDQTTRVYDMVPVRALAQESAGNRIIYGNFVKNHTAPKSIGYKVSVNEKQDYSLNFIEYPNHTLKQNRTYQVGFILADKYGRQSSVILSLLDTLATVSEGNKYGGSTIYSPYFTKSNAPVIKNWFGNALSVLVESPINSNNNIATGEPGLYATTASIGGFNLTGTTTITSTTYTFTVADGIIPTEGEYLKGQYIDYVQITAIDITSAPTYIITTEAQVSDFYERVPLNDPFDTKWSYNINPLGWYSYKVVVRQQEQEYYNVYLPGMLNGYPKGQTYGSQVNYVAGTPSLDNGINTTIFPVAEINKVAHTVLINDNINKIPRDLTEVGPDQKLYRSSVQLFGRVQNTINGQDANNIQYYPSLKADVAIAIGTSDDLSMYTSSVTNTLGSAVFNFYQLETTPLIARISTSNAMGVTSVENTEQATLPITYTNSDNNMQPYLSVYETKPVYSLLDIFWETSTSGLISDLNADVLTGFEGIVGLSDINWDFKESKDPLSVTEKYISGEFWPISLTYTELPSTGATIIVRDNTNSQNIVTGKFGIETIDVGGGINHYRLYIQDYFVFINDIASTSFTFEISITTEDSPTPIVFEEIGRLENVAPTILNTCPVTLALPSPNPTPGVPIYIYQANNGAYLNAFKKVELDWKILNTSTLGWESLFSIVKNPTTGDGELFLLDTFPTSEVFTLNIEVKDAVNSLGIPTSDPQLKYRSQTDECTITISIGIVEICGRSWGARNADWVTYSDGTPIPEVSNAAIWGALETGAWCYYDNDPLTGAVYGKLYNWYAVMGIYDAASLANSNLRKQFAPANYHVVYASNVNSGATELCALWACTSNTASNAGGTLKEEGTAHWDNPNTGATNSTLFTALPGGRRKDDGTFEKITEEGYWWFGGLESGYEPLDPTSAGNWNLSYTSAAVMTGGSKKKEGLSVRITENYSVTWVAYTSGDNCQTIYLDENGNIQEIILGGVSGPEQSAFITSAPCAITGTCGVFQE